MASDYLISVFSTPSLKQEKEVLEYTERFLWGDLSHFGERLWNFMKFKTNSEDDSFLYKYSYRQQIEKYDVPSFKHFKQKIEQEKKFPYWEQYPDDYLTVDCGSFFIWIYKNGAAFLNMGHIYVPSMFFHPDTVEYRAFIRTWTRELVDALQPDPCNRSIIYTSDRHPQDVEDYLTPFSIDACIQKMRTSHPDHERPLMHDFTQDWDSFFWYSSHPFFIVDQR